MKHEKEAGKKKGGLLDAHRAALLGLIWQSIESYLRIANFSRLAAEQRQSITIQKYVSLVE